MLALVILVTALSGFGISFGLLKWGVTSMGLRYPLAVLGAYGIFLALIRLWVEVERRHFDPNDPEIQKALQSEDEPYESPVRKSDAGWWDWLDFPSDLDAEGCLPTLLIGAVLGLFVLLVSAIGAAPVLFAEVFIDVVLASLLYRRLRIAASEHWLGTAIRKTWLHVLGVALLMGVAGGCLDKMATGSDTMGKAIKELRGRGKQ